MHPLRSIVFGTSAHMACLAIRVVSPLSPNDNSTASTAQPIPANPPIQQRVAAQPSPHDPAPPGRCELRGCSFTSPQGTSTALDRPACSTSALFRKRSPIRSSGLLTPSGPRFSAWV